MVNEAAGSLPEIDVFSRPGCHLCEVLIDELLPLIRGRLQLCVHDIDRDERLLDQYGLRIPVVRFQGTDVCQFTLDKAAIVRILNAESA